MGVILPYEKLLAGDTIGFGINSLKRSFFMVKNGEIVLQDIAIPANWSEFYPAVGVSH